VFRRNAMKRFFVLFFVSTALFLFCISCSDSKSNNVNDEDVTDLELNDESDDTSEVENDVEKPDYPESPDEKEVPDDSEDGDDGENDDTEESDEEESDTDTPDEEPDTEPIPDNIIFVNTAASGTNDGTSWENAFTSFQSALNETVTGKEIWVAKGIYYPESFYDFSELDEKNVHFRLKNGVEIYGGFEGTEVYRSDRDLDAGHDSILSGEIKPAADPADESVYSYRVFYNDNIDETAILDGFTITKGFNIAGRGGGMLNINSSPVLRNILFTENKAENGGALHNRDGSSPKIESCRFINNRAYESGGAIINYNGSSPIIIDSVFENNRAEDNGGAVSNVKGSLALIKNCTFTKNAVINSDDPDTGYGGAIINSDFSNAEIRDSVFTQNTSVNYGGAILNHNSGVLIENCQFIKNRATVSGGAVLTISQPPAVVPATVINNSIFNENIAGKGGALASAFSKVKVTSSMFSKNSKDLDGETVNMGGGVIYAIQGAEVSLINSLFRENGSEGNGGVALLETSSKIYILNSTMTLNTSLTSGGAIFLSDTTQATIINSILWNNGDGGGKVKLEIAGAGTLDATYSLIKKADLMNPFNPAPYPGEGNLNTDPLFGKGYTLQSTSPAIDKGTLSPYGEGEPGHGITKDLQGNPRLSKNKLIDMGAYEYHE
jgi:hypothetical protein